jgi:hypothetical protein
LSLPLALPLPLALTGKTVRADVAKGGFHRIRLGIAAALPVTALTPVIAITAFLSCDAAHGSCQRIGLGLLALALARPAWRTTVAPATAAIPIAIAAPGARPAGPVALALPGAASIVGRTRPAASACSLNQGPYVAIIQLHPRAAL